MSTYRYKVVTQILMVDGRGNTTTVGESEVGPFETRQEAEDYLARLDETGEIRA